jgi:hypothetical protein
MSRRLGFALTIVPLVFVLLGACSGQSPESPDAVSTQGGSTQGGPSAAPTTSASVGEPAADPAERKRQLVQCLSEQGVEIKDKEHPMREVMGLDQDTVNRVMRTCMKYVPSQMH